MEHLNDSFLAVEEHIIEAIRKLGVNCMGIDPDATRREALDELAMGLESLKTGEELVTSDAVATAKAAEGHPTVVDMTDENTEIRRLQEAAKAKAREESITITLPRRALVRLFCGGSTEPGKALTLSEALSDNAREHASTLTQILSTHVHEEEDTEADVLDRKNATFHLHEQQEAAAEIIRAVRVAERMPSDLDLSDNGSEAAR